MEFLLTLFICTGIGNNCLPVTQDMHTYQMNHATFSSCIKDGLGQSFEVFYNSDLITDEQINIDLGRFEDIIDYNNIFYVLLKHSGHSSINTNNINVKVDLLVHNRNLD